MGKQTYYKLRTIVLIFPMSFTACANINRTSLIFTSEPEGATFTEISTGIGLGAAPLSKRYNLDSEGALDQQGCYVLEGVEAHWESGATAQIVEFQLCGSNDQGYQVSLVRPESHPDLEKDIEVSNSRQVIHARRGIPIFADSGSNLFDATNCVSCTTKLQRRESR